METTFISTLNYLADISQAVSRGNVRQIKLLLDESKSANKKANSLTTSVLMPKETADMIIRLKRNANALSMTLSIVQDIYVNMNTEISSIYKSLTKLEKDKQRRMLKAQRNKRYTSKKKIKAIQPDN